MTRPTLALLVAAGFALAAGPKEPSTDLANHAPLAAAIQKAGTVTVYEGLPHQANEKAALDAELKAKKTVPRHGFPFYAEPLVVSADERKALTALTADPKSVQKFGGPKKCGGFHPDYLVEWGTGDDAVRLLVCFGCHEVRMYGPKNDLYADMSDAGLHGLEKILKPLRKNRPKPEE